MIKIGFLFEAYAEEQKRGQQATAMYLRYPISFKKPESSFYLFSIVQKLQPLTINTSTKQTSCLVKTTFYIYYNGY